MLKTRLIAVIIVRHGQVVQSVNFKHTNVIHYDVIHAIEAFNDWAVDELVLLNVSRKKDSQDQFLSVVESASKYCFIPLAVGGWIDSPEYAQQILRSGADKMILNSALVNDPELVKELSSRYGAQCIVGSIDIKKSDSNQSTVWIDRGRFDTGKNPEHWANQIQELGVGEILLNSIDHDGARRGYDLENLEKICKVVKIPVIAFGGVFDWEHLLAGVMAGADAVAAANIFHYTEQSTKKAKRFLIDNNIDVRRSGALEVQH